MEQVIPHNQRKFEQLFVVKREKADWRKVFKREWKELSTRLSDNNIYLTDINNWICGCPAFLTSRFLICKHLIQKKGSVAIQFFDEIHRHHQYPFLNNLSLQITNFGQINLQIPNIEIVEDDVEVYDEIYNRLIDITERVLEILKDQRMRKNFKWIQSVEKNFRPMEVMLSEITLYKRRRTMPRTFKDHSHNTLFFG
jgi:hypothetical protein